MLGDPFYHGSIRKYVIAFGTLFNNISIIRRTSDNAEVQRLRIPLAWATKEKYIQRVIADPNIVKPMGSLWPRMAFQLTGMRYDAARQMSPVAAQYRVASSTTQTSMQWSPVPYTFDFQLSIIARNIDDGLQIIEQILPYFQPHMGMEIQTVPSMGLTYPTQITMTGITPQTDGAEGPMPESQRLVSWDLTFELQGVLYGPTSTRQIIREVDVDVFEVSSGDIVFTRPFTILSEDGDRLMTEDTDPILQETEDENLGVATRVARVTTVPDPINAEPGDSFTANTTIQDFVDARVYDPEDDEDVDP